MDQKPAQLTLISTKHVEEHAQPHCEYPNGQVRLLLLMVSQSYHWSHRPHLTL